MTSCASHHSIACSFDVREMSNYSCPLCSEFTGLRFHQLLSHIQLVHSSRPAFQIVCRINGCTRSFTLKKTYRNHLYGDHIINFKPDSIVYQPSSQQIAIQKCQQTFRTSLHLYPVTYLIKTLIIVNQTVYNFCTHTIFQVCCINQSYNSSMYKFNIILQTVENVVMDSTASLILKTKECIKLPQSTLETIIEDVTLPFQFVHDNMYQYALAKHKESSNL